MWLGPLLVPVLLAAFPILSLFAHNQSDIALSVIWSPLVVAASIAGLLFAISVVVLKRATRAAVLSSVVILTFYYGLFRDTATGWGLPDATLLPLWSILFALGVFGVVRARSGLRNVTWMLGAAAAVSVASPVVQIVSYRIEHPPVGVADARLWPTPIGKPVRPPGARPDVYYLIPDDYARADVLKQYMGYDNSGFLRQLRQRGFTIADQVRSPYSKRVQHVLGAQPRLPEPPTERPRTGLRGCRSRSEDDRGQPCVAVSEVARLPLHPHRLRQHHVRGRQPAHISARRARQPDV